jgi:hypothetical protein
MGFAEVLFMGDRNEKVVVLREAVAIRVEGLRVVDAEAFQSQPVANEEALDAGGARLVHPDMQHQAGQGTRHSRASGEKSSDLGRRWKRLDLGIRAAPMSMARA